MLSTKTKFIILMKISYSMFLRNNSYRYLALTKNVSLYINFISQLTLSLFEVFDIDFLRDNALGRNS